jgi:hypothetical protein
MNLRLYEVAMAGCIRVLLIDLLAERATFGHGGNQEVVRPLAAAGDVEVLLVTPQYQSIESSNQSVAGEVNLTEVDVPDWDDDYPFWQSTEVELEGRIVTFRRIVMPMHEDQERMKSWLAKNQNRCTRLFRFTSKCQHLGRMDGPCWNADAEFCPIRDSNSRNMLRPPITLSHIRFDN